MCELKIKIAFLKPIKDWNWKKWITILTKYCHFGVTFILYLKAKTYVPDFEHINCGLKRSVGKNNCIDQNHCSMTNLKWATTMIGVESVVVCFIPYKKRTILGPRAIRTIYK